MSQKEREFNKKILDENNELREQNKRMKNAMSEFIYRVEAGEVRSTYTYNLFKKVLGQK